MRIGELDSRVWVYVARPTWLSKSVPAVSLPQLKADADSRNKRRRRRRPMEVPKIKIESVTKQIDSFLRSFGRSINFRVDPGSGQMIVSVIDATTGEVIRQVPGEDALKLAQSIEARMSAMVDTSA